MVRILLIVIVVLVVALTVWFCRPADRGLQIAAQTTDPDQMRLWQDAGRRGVPPGIERLPVVNPGVRPGQAPPRPSTQTITPGQGSLAPGLQTAARLISVPDDGTWEYSGKAIVADAVGERVELLIGARQLVFAARLDGKPLGLAKGQAVDLTVRSTASVFNRREIFAVRTPNGAEIITALQTGSVPVSLTVPLAGLTFTASQTGIPANGSMPVVIDTGAAKEIVAPARVLQSGGLSVRLLGSVARGVTDGLPGDSSPYAIDLIAWRAGK
jgi:hypothetical protein